MGDVTATNGRDNRQLGTRGPLVAGVELSADIARVIVATRENARLRVTGRGEAGLVSRLQMLRCETDADGAADVLPLGAEA